MPHRQRILLTGASSGLGAQMAREFASRGRDLVLCARRQDKLTELRHEIDEHWPGTRVLLRELDVTDAAAVRDAVHGSAEELGGLDRLVVNAGSGGGRPIGSGQPGPNATTAMTNFVGALHQCESAMEVFRRQGRGHLVVVSSMSALRGLPGGITTYAATKAGISSLAAGIRAEVAGTPIAVTTLLPGYIDTELTSGRPGPLMASTERGVRAMVAAIEAERATAIVPPWPWLALAPLMKLAPSALLRRAV